MNSDASGSANNPLSYRRRPGSLSPNLSTIRCMTLASDRQSIMATPAESIPRGDAEVAPAIPAEPVRVATKL